MARSGFAGGAESMASLVEEKLGISVGPIERPPSISKKQIAFLLLVLLLLAPYLVKRVLDGETLVHDWRLWTFLAIFMYFFSVGGNMNTIIRNTPMFIPDRNEPEKMMFFYPGSGMLLGAEGFVIGFLYMVVGLILVIVRNVTVQRDIMLLAMVVAFWVVRKVVLLDNWKTGYSIHAFFLQGGYDLEM